MLIQYLAADFIASILLESTVVDIVLFLSIFKFIGVYRSILCNSLPYWRQRQNTDSKQFFWWEFMSRNKRKFCWPNLLTPLMWLRLRSVITQLLSCVYLRFSLQVIAAFLWRKEKKTTFFLHCDKYIQAREFSRFLTKDTSLNAPAWILWTIDPYINRF